MISLAVLSLSAAACGGLPPALCETANGLQLESDVLPVDCTEFEAAEAETLAAMRTTHGDSRVLDGSRLWGWRVVREAGPQIWSPRFERMVDGNADCSTKVIRLPGKAWLEGGLPHELVHALQNCVADDSREQIGTTLEGHELWLERGIHPALNQLTISALQRAGKW